MQRVEKEGNRGRLRGRRGTTRTGALIVAALGSLGYPAVWAAAPLHGAAASAPADPCADERNWRPYRVAAIDVTMVLNRFGDRDDHAFMYVLADQVTAIEKWQEEPGCTSWQGEGGHKSCVSSGLSEDKRLRSDLVQPLVLRANLGQCLVIDFINHLDPKKPGPDLLLDRKWPNDGKASLDVSGLAYSVDKDGAPDPALPTETTAGPGEKLRYKIPLPSDPAAERAYYFQDGGGNRQRVPHGLFGVIVAEPAGSKYLDPETGESADGTGWQAMIEVPDKPDFREFVLIYHEVGDENYDRIIDGTKDKGDANRPLHLPQLIEEGVFPPLEETYRPAGRALNYRSEPFLHRLQIKTDPKGQAFPFEEKKALAYSSYTFGDPATPIPRSYLGEPTKTRLVHGGSEVFHVHHLHGGGDRWRRNPKSDPHNDIASGLNKAPNPNVFSTHLDSQTIGPGTSYNLEHECGAGGCQQAAGDFLYHCHIGHHYIGGMWGLWRVFDTRQKDLAKLPDMPDPLDPPAAVDSTQLVDKTFGGKKVVANADPNDSNQISLKEWVELQLPPQGKRIDDDDATVWDWDVDESDRSPCYDRRYPCYLGEPETEAEWVNYPFDSRPRPGGKPGEQLQPGERPVILFNKANGRYAWPLFRPHLGQRPPFAPNGHSGAPWLGEQGSTNRRDGLCPDPKEWDIPYQTIRHYPISAVPIDIPRNDEEIDTEGRVFVLNEDIRGETAPDPFGNIKVLLDNFKNLKPKRIEPLVIRSNVGDCVRVIFTSRLNRDPTTGSKVNMHTHFVQFDPQASDGVISGFSYEQSVRPYRDEKRLDNPQAPPTNEGEVRRLVAAVAPEAPSIVVNQRYRLRPGIWLGVGLGEGVYDANNSCCIPKGDTLTPRTEIRRITDITETPGPDPNARTYTITLDQPLRLPHEEGEAVGVEFVQYNWYSDVDTGTVFWHDHVDFKSWGHGLASAHVIEPAPSTWHDPETGRSVRSGAIVDVHLPKGASAGVGASGSFREFVLFNIREQLGKELFGERKATINLRREPIVDPRDTTLPDTDRKGRKGDPAYWFSSVTHGDPATPLPRAYVGDPFMIRHLGVLDREGGIRITGHRFRIERFAEPGAFSDGSPIGISERYDLVLDGGAGGPLGKPGDFLYYNTIGRDMLGGAWGLIRVHDTLQEEKHQMPLKPLPDRSPPQRGKGFPHQSAAAGPNSPARPDPAGSARNPCPASAPERHYFIHLRKTKILRQGRLEEIDSHPELTINDGIAFTHKDQPEEYTLEPLVLRVNQGECLVVELTNRLPKDPQDPAHSRAGWHVGELLFDPQDSYGLAVGRNDDSTIAPGETRIYRYFADHELGTTLALNLANPITVGKGSFGAVIVEPMGSQYQEYKDPATGKPVKIGVFADIIAPKGRFREIVTLFHDSDPIVGQNQMTYPWEAHCFPAKNFSDEPDNCDVVKTNVVTGERDPVDHFKGTFTSISYKVNRWWDRNADDAPSDVYNSKAKGPDGKEHGDPGLVIAGPPGFPLVFRVAAPWGEQLHSFSLSGHRWPLEPRFNDSEQVFAHLLAPGYSFDVPVIGGFGGGSGITGDFLFRDARMPFTQGGLWGLIRVSEEEPK